MKQYTVRDEKGKMVAVLGRQVMLRVLLDIEGYWREYKTKTETTRCFVVTEDCSYGLSNGDTVLRVYLWEGYVIVEDIK